MKGKVFEGLFALSELLITEVCEMHIVLVRYF